MLHKMCNKEIYVIKFTSQENFYNDDVGKIVFFFFAENYNSTIYQLSEKMI